MKIIWCWMMNKKWPTDSLNQIHRLDCMDNLHKSCTSRIQVEFDNFVFQFHCQWHWENDLNIAYNQKSQNLKYSKPIKTFWKRSNWNRNEIRNGNDLLRTFWNSLVTSNTSDPKRKKKISKKAFRKEKKSSQQSAILTTILCSSLISW